MEQGNWNVDEMLHWLDMKINREDRDIREQRDVYKRQVRDKDAVSRFLESVDQFERILNDSVFIRLERLTTDEIVGTPQQAGLIEKYFSLSQQDTTTLKDIQMSASKMLSLIHI